LIASEQGEKNVNIQISYFSGTGCTEYVAQTFASEFRTRGLTVINKNIVNDSTIEENMDFLIICFVVHACNAPEPVMNWVKQLKPVDDKNVVVVSVSGGGEVTPNLACRVPIKKALRKKKYHIGYEKMLVMPSNWIIETKPVLSSQLLVILPKKISYIVNDILHGKKHLTHPLLGNRILTTLGKLEHLGAHKFGKGIKVDLTCNSCGLCLKQCPVSNIEFYNQKPIFSNKCIICLNCIYSCPQRALVPTKMKFVVIRSGFSFKKILALPRENIDISKEAKGLTWIGVKRYLLNTSDIL